MTEVSQAGWKKVDVKTETGIKEEEVRSLFNMIDKDKSGSLSLRVGRVLRILPSPNHLLFRRQSVLPSLSRIGFI
jgi:hypothetical protein